MVSLYNRLDKIPLLIFVSLSFAVAICCYWSALNGLPIFDDLHFIFQDIAIIGDYSYYKIWTDFAWPLSISIHKFFFGVWEHEYFYYHLLNLTLHLLNSFMLLKLAINLKLPFPKLIFVFFLLHPSNTISVSWMVQLKTLLCFTFAITAFLFLLKALENKKWFLPSWLFFYFSLISKTASLPLGLFFILFVFKKMGSKALVWTIPYLVLINFSGYTILQSTQTSTAAAQFESQTFVDAKIHESLKPLIDDNQKNTVIDYGNKIKDRIVLIVKTSHYYFWQVLLPLDSYPVKGQVTKDLSLLEGFHIIFVVLLCVLNFGTLASQSLLAGHLMILPFLGFFTAPYMNLTWVSEQHLYLALPFFLSFWLSLLFKLKFRFSYFVPLIFLVFFTVQTFKAASFYKNEVIFYSKSLLADPLNIPIAQNLAVSYLDINQPMQALAVTSKIIYEAETNKEVRESKYYHYLRLLHADILKQLASKL